MKKLLILAAFSCLEARIVVDKIVARVNGVNVLQSDTTRSRINSKPYSLNEAIMQELLFQEATRLQMVPSSLEIEKYIAAYRSNDFLKGLSDEDFERHLSESEGFSLNEFKREYTRFSAVTNLLGHEMQTRVFVTNQEVENFYENNPVFAEESYKLKTAMIPFKGEEASEEVAEIKDSDWVVHDEWIEKSNIADSMSHISKLKVGETSSPVRTAYGFQVVKLLDKRPRRKKELKERYNDIEKMLREQKMSKFESAYKKELEHKATIVYLG